MISRKKIIAVISPLLLLSLLAVQGCGKEDPCKKAQEELDKAHIELGKALERDHITFTSIPSPVDSSEVKVLKESIKLKKEQRDNVCKNK